ncbi:MAG: AraC family transcriptional regulator, partial [Cellvibrionaceae bacterium]|nr:AraC family transcriptional regulator [Cellvibrionaceae bacterium]
LASALFFFSRHLSEPCVPIETFLPHPAPSDDRLHRRVFGDNIHYNYAYSGFIIDASILSYRVNDADTHLLEVLKSHADRLLSANRESSDIVSHLRLLIATSLSGQAFSATEAAQAMNMDRKTLYRHLSQAGLRYKTVKADVLTGLAKLALSESAANITEIGMQLGYSEASAFVRAFKHTTGITPLQYRRLHGLGL